MSSSKGKSWYLDIDHEKHQIYVYKDNKRLRQEGGPGSGKEYGQVCQLTRYVQPKTEATLLKVTRIYSMIHSCVEHGCTIQILILL